MNTHNANSVNTHEHKTAKYIKNIEREKDSEQKNVEYQSTFDYTVYK